MKRIIEHKSVVAALVAVGMSFPMAAAQAETKNSSDTEYDLSSDDGGIERIEAASDFESLGQEIAAAACIFAKSDHAAEAAPILVHSIEKFDEDLDALRNGDPEHGMAEAEHNHRVLVRLDKLEEIWAPFRQATQNLIDGKNIDESLAYIGENNLALLDAAERLFTEVSTEYANPVLVTESEALLLDFSSRERMLIERIAKESCGVVFGLPAFGSLEDLNKSIATFQAILAALTNGMPSAGVVPAPTKEIHDALQEVHDHWGDAKEILDKVTGTDSIDHDTMEKLFTLLEKKREKFDKIELMYGHYAHTHH